VKDDILGTEMSTEAAIFERLRPTLARALSVSPEEITLTSSMDLTQWDSLNFLVVIYTVEKEFGFNFDRRELMELRSVEDLIRGILKREKQTP
jgi:acyl carrier protein